MWNGHRRDIVSVHSRDASTPPPRRRTTHSAKLTQADHDSNVQPWVLAAQRAGCEIRYMTVREDGSLDVDSLETLVDENTRLIACGLASNGTGTIHDCQRISTLKNNALTFFDGVHYAPHNLIDVQALDADFLVVALFHSIEIFLWEDNSPS